MEAGTTSPHLDTVIKVLAALGKTLYVGELNPNLSETIQ
jgi:DNA-binding phage protein